MLTTKPSEGSASRSWRSEVVSCRKDDIGGQQQRLPFSQHVVFLLTGCHCVSLASSPHLDADHTGIPPRHPQFLLSRSSRIEAFLCTDVTRIQDVLVSLGCLLSGSDGHLEVLPLLTPLAEL